MPFLTLAAASFLFPLGFSKYSIAADIVFVAASSDQFHHPHDLTLDPGGGYLFVADMNNDVVKILDPQNLDVVGEIGNGELSSPHDVEFDAKGRLLVADSGNHRLVIYTVNGLDANKHSTVTHKMRSPEGVAAGEQYELYVANTGSHNVVHFKVYTENKAFATSGKAGGAQSEYIRPHDVEISGNRLYVTDPGNNRIKILDFELNVQQILGGPGYTFNEPKYLALDKHSRLYVADQYNNRIQIFAAYPKHDDLLASITSYSINGKTYRLNKPEGVEVRGEWIWISDTYNDRILLYRWSE
jgi:DNA-binding beta-propeller fold protein YncE